MFRCRECTCASVSPLYAHTQINILELAILYLTADAAQSPKVLGVSALYFEATIIYIRVRDNSKDQKRIYVYIFIYKKYM